MRLAYTHPRHLHEVLRNEWTWFCDLKPWRRPEETYYWCVALLSVVTILITRSRMHVTHMDHFWKPPIDKRSNP